MNRVFHPKAVAVVGASAEDGKIGNSVMKNLINGGYKGNIYPVHPKADKILGRKVFKSVLDIPGRVDVAVFAIPAKFCCGALREVGQKGIAGGRVGYYRKGHKLQAPQQAQPAFPQAWNSIWR